MLPEFSFLRDLLRNLILGKKKLSSFFPGQEFPYFKNWFGTIEGLPVYFHLSFFNIWGQNPYGFRIIWSSFFWQFFSTDQKVSSNWLEISYKVLERTSAGKICINYRRPSENFFNFSRKDVGRKKKLLQAFFFISGGYRQNK